MSLIGIEGGGVKAYGKCPPKSHPKKSLKNQKSKKNLHEIYFNKICELGVLRGVQIKSLLGYIDSCSSLIGPRYFFYFPRPVIGQEARNERIVAFIKIITVANLYFYFFSHKTPGTL